jgi:L-ribulose-5-phosphate 4-epimerase
MLELLKETVCAANRELPARGLVTYTWGNVSGIDRERGLIVIKPSGVAYETLTADDMAVVDLDGTTVEGRLRPSSDLATHLELYRCFPAIGGIVHTHSDWATSWAQACRPIPALGTTHADYFYGDIPCTRALSPAETKGDFERNTGRVIAETVAPAAVLDIPAILVANHGPFAWGRDAADAVYHAVVLEEVAKMAWRTLLLNPDSRLPQELLDRHYQRKHGANAYYGQQT